MAQQGISTYVRGRLDFGSGNQVTINLYSIHRSAGSIAEHNRNLKEFDKQGVLIVHTSPFMVTDEKLPRTQTGKEAFRNFLAGVYYGTNRNIYQQLAQKDSLTVVWGAARPQTVTLSKTEINQEIVWIEKRRNLYLNRNGLTEPLAQSEGHQIEVLRRESNLGHRQPDAQTEPGISQHSNQKPATRYLITGKYQPDGSIHLYQQPSQANPKPGQPTPAQGNFVIGIISKPIETYGKANLEMQVVQRFRQSSPNAETAWIREVKLPSGERIEHNIFENLDRWGVKSLSGELNQETIILWPSAEEVEKTPLQGKNTFPIGNVSDLRGFAFQELKELSLNRLNQKMGISRVQEVKNLEINRFVFPVEPEITARVVQRAKMQNEPKFSPTEREKTNPGARALGEPTPELGSASVPYPIQRTGAIALNGSGARITSDSFVPAHPTNDLVSGNEARLLAAYATENRIPAEYLTDLRKAGLIRTEIGLERDYLVFTHRGLDEQGKVSSREASYARIGGEDNGHNRLREAKKEAAAFWFQTGNRTERVILTNTAADSLQYLHYLEQTNQPTENLSFFSLNGGDRWPIKELAGLRQHGIPIEIAFNQSREPRPSFNVMSVRDFLPGTQVNGFHELNLGISQTEPEIGKGEPNHVPFGTVEQIRANSAEQNFADAFEHDL